MSRDRITSFAGEYAFLSNFYQDEVPLRIGFGYMDYENYPTVEHFYQEQKTRDIEWRARIRAAETPGEAKRLGRAAPQRKNWAEIKNGVMWTGLNTKFDQSYPLAIKLRDTHPAHLEEGNSWGDRYFGTVNGIGENVLGKMLMIIRAEKKAVLG